MARIYSEYALQLTYLFVFSKILLTLSTNLVEVEGKKVIVTGAAQGIGYATAEKLLESGANVIIIIDIDLEKGIEAYNTLSSTHGKDRVEFINCDITECLESTYSYITGKYGNIDLLVNNAGIQNEDDVDRTVNVNLLATMKWSLKYLEHMRIDKNGTGGAIINISSTAAFRIYYFIPVYTATKFGILGFSETLGYPSNFEKHGVRILTVCPGYTNTSLAARLVATSDPEVQELFANTPLQEPSVVGAANVEVYKTASSGTAWVIEDGELSQLVQ